MKKNTKKISAFVFLFTGLFLMSQTVLADDTFDITSQPFSQHIPQNAIRVPFLIIKIKPKKDVWVSEIDVKQTGLSSSSDIKKVYAVLDGKRSFGVSVNNDSRAYIKFMTPIFLKEGKVAEARIEAHLNSQGARTIGFTLEKIQTVVNGKVRRK